MTTEKTPRRRAEPAEPTGPRLIRKYGNRRLYDTHDSHYVTLGDLVDVFSGEEEVKVVDAVSGEDLTKKVLAQAILFEEERRRSQIIPIQVLRTFLRHRGESMGKIAKMLGDVAPKTKGAPPDTNDSDELLRRIRTLESQIKKK